MKKSLLLLSVVFACSLALSQPNEGVIRHELHKLYRMDKPIEIVMDQTKNMFDHISPSDMIGDCSPVKKKLPEETKKHYKECLKNLIVKAHDDYEIFHSPNISFIWRVAGTITQPFRYFYYRTVRNSLEQEIQELDNL